MNSKNEINYNLINDLYIEWLNERDPFMQRKSKENIKSKISPYEFLMYSNKKLGSLRAFRDIYSLDDLFKTLEKMKEKGENIESITQQILAIETIEDIQSLNKISQKETCSEISEFGFRFVGNNVFKYGDIKNIGKKFPYSYAHMLEIELIEQMITEENDYKGIPICMIIDNIGQLPLEKLEKIEEKFDITGIKIIEKERKNRIHQGERKAIDVEAYKRIKQIVDEDFIKKLYVTPSRSKGSIDLELSTQIISILVNKIEYDFEAAKEENLRFSDIVSKASGLVGLLTGKSICKGYSEILRNILSCVNVPCRVVEGVYMDGSHAWNEVKIGDTWTNVDVTTARSKIREGEPSGNLFMSDMAFFGDVKQATFEKGQQINGKSIEAIVMIGGHQIEYIPNNRKFESYMPPYITAALIRKSKQYEEEYKKYGKTENYKGPVPYVGSDIEKMRSSVENISISPEYE